MDISFVLSDEPIATSITAYVMHEITGISIDDYYDYVKNWVAASNYIDFDDIEAYI